MNQDFELHPRLQQDCAFIGDFTLCRLLIMKDANYPWFILAPRRADIREIHQLAAVDRQLLLQESCLLAEALEAAFTPDKLNIAALGNMVPQLHLHHVVRYQNDPAWPAPIWGKCAAKTYRPAELAERIEKLQTRLPQEFFTRCQ